MACLLGLVFLAGACSSDDGVDASGVGEPSAQPQEVLRYQAALATIDDSSVFVYGGSSPGSPDSDFLDDAFIWSPGERTAEALSSAPLPPLRTPSAAAAGGSMILAGIACADDSPQVELDGSPEFSECSPGTPAIATLHLETLEWTIVDLPEALSDVAARSVDGVFQFPTVKTLGSFGGLGVLDISAGGGELWTLDPSTGTLAPLSLPEGRTSLAIPGMPFARAFASCSTSDSFVLLPFDPQERSLISHITDPAAGWTTSDLDLGQDALGGVACSDTQALVYPQVSVGSSALFDPASGRVTPTGPVAADQTIGLAPMTWVGDRFIGQAFDGSAGLEFRIDSGWSVTEPWPTLAPLTGPIAGIDGSAVFFSEGSLDGGEQEGAAYVSGELVSYG